MRAMKWFVILALVIAVAPAAAQDPDKKININVGGGYTFALSEVRNYIGDGYNFSAGLTFNFTPKMGLQVEYGLSNLGDIEVNLPICAVAGCTNASARPFWSDQRMQHVNFNLVFRGNTSGNVHPYALIGAGYYNRPVKVTSDAKAGFVAGYCNPLWYWCQPGGWVDLTTLVGSRSSSDVGMDFGGGVYFKVSNAVSLYLEAKYHYIWGPSYSVTDANNKVYSGKANGKFVPFVVGIRF